MPTSHSQNSYDEVPYDSKPFVQTHPDRLATLARLFGLSPPPLTHCRVLELGCASGGNLIPMACTLPDSEFVGVDLSGREIEMGRETVRALGLDNIILKHASILDIDEGWGLFDYIICHGVFSWVTEDVQNQILTIAARQLTPHGIAYISYNCYPGWHMREMIRHMMCYHAERFGQPAERIEQARALLDFLVGSVPADSGAYGQLLQSELELIRQCADSYLFHEHLEQVNKPIYFHQFIERAEGWGLQYLAEADFAVMLTGRFSPETAETLEKISQDIIHLEQYMDFVRNRLFRQTLLCHRNLALRRALNPAVLHGLLAASAASPETETIDLSPGVKITFRIGDGTSLETESPVTKAAFALLHEHWPCAIAIDTLCLAALERAAAIIPSAERETHRRTLMQDLFQCYLANLIELRTWQPPCVNQITAQPKAYPLAVFQATKGMEVANVRHETVNLDPFARELMPALDGERDRTELIEHLLQRTRDGALRVLADDLPVSDESQVRGILDQTLADALARLSRAALLVG